MTDDNRRTETFALPRTAELHALGSAQIDQLAEMVLELAAQLHVERTRIRILEHHLSDSGLPPAGDQNGDLPTHVREQLSRELDRSLAGLLAAPTERDDARAPLRVEPRAGQVG